MQTYIEKPTLFTWGAGLATAMIVNPIVAASGALHPYMLLFSIGSAFAAMLLIATLKMRPTVARVIAAAPMLLTPYYIFLTHTLTA